MKDKIGEWAGFGYHFNLDWLLRSVNTVLTGEAKFQFLHDRSAEDIRDGLGRANKHIDTCLNLIGGRLGLDHDQVLLRTLCHSGHGPLSRPAKRADERAGARQAAVLVRSGGDVGAVFRFDRVVYRLTTWPLWKARMAVSTG